MNNPLNNPFTRYELKEPLIALHNGHLYKAQDLSLHRTVLLFLVKISPLHGAKPYIDSLGKTGHEERPALMHILDVEVADGKLAVIMPFESGHPLVQLVERNSLTVTEIVDMLVTLGTELQAVQLHRPIDFSLRPGNLWMQQDGKLKVIHTWEDGPPQYPSRELSKLLYQLLTKSSYVPDNMITIEQELLEAMQEQEVPQAYQSQLLHAVHLAMTENVPLAGWVRTLKGGISEHEAELHMNEQITAAFEPVVPKKKRSFSISGSKILIGMGALVTSLIVFVGVLTLLFGALTSSLSPKNSKQTVVQHVTPTVSAAPALEQPAPKPVKQTPAAPADSVEVRVPVLTGLSREEAEKQSLASGLRYSFFLEPNAQPAGSVFKQEPAANETVAKGSRVTFWVSKGIQ